MKPPTHHCDDCGAVWPCYDEQCDTPVITLCAKCEDARGRWAWLEQATQALKEVRRADHRQ